MVALEGEREQEEEEDGRGLIYQDPYGSISDGRYERGGKLGQGAFGVVYRALDTQRGESVALKYVQCRGSGSDSVLPKCAFRELAALRQLGQLEHVVRLLDVRVDGTAAVLVLELTWTDMASLLDSMSHPMPEAEVKDWAGQLLTALHHVHGCGLMHRDVKPGNLLVTRRGVLKLCDFGLARVYDNPRGGSFSHQVATRWYRAPELLYGSRGYGPGVDMWAAGCVIAEMVLNSPLFPGQSDIDQIAKVLGVMGSPITEDAWPSAHSLPDFSKITFKVMPAQPFPNIFLGATEPLVKLLESLIVLDPAQRQCATNALASECFASHPLPRRADVRMLEKFLAEAAEEVGHDARNSRQPGSLNEMCRVLTTLQT
jgi:cell cycle related kinase